MWNSFNSFGYGMHTPFLAVWGPIFGLVALLALALKGYALWHAAKRNEIWWFLAMFIINTMGILELIYIGVVLKKFNSHKKIGESTPNQEQK
ncbi:MAG: DUF5652 family protein [Patescibacteria group bacterium]